MSHRGGRRLPSLSALAINPGRTIIGAVTSAGLSANSRAARSSDLLTRPTTPDVARADHKRSTQRSTSTPRPPSDIYDALGLVSWRHRQLVTLASGFSFTEGPAVDRHGNVFFTDQPNDRVYRWDARSGKVTLFLE